MMLELNSFLRYLLYNHESYKFVNDVYDFIDVPDTNQDKYMGQGHIFLWWNMEWHLEYKCFPSPEQEK